MKSKFLFSLMMMAVMACNTKPEATTGLDAKNEAQFKANEAVVKSILEAFSKKDLSTVSNYLSDDFKHYSRAIGDTATSKQAWLDSLAVLNKYSNLTFENFDMYPGMTPQTETENIDVRVYMTIKADASNGSKVSVFYYGLWDFNNAGKIYEVKEFYDATEFKRLVTAAAPK